jgi:hypothetical protein
MDVTGRAMAESKTALLHGHRVGLNIDGIA